MEIIETVPYDLDYALFRLREAIDFAELEGDFQPARKWTHEVELLMRHTVQPEGCDNSMAGQLRAAGYGDGGVM
jgi:hypothetical protein